jgi:hypothetical protein
MTPLRRRLIDDMTLRNLTPETIKAYVGCVGGARRPTNNNPPPQSLASLATSTLPPSIWVRNTFAPSCSISSRNVASP